jgi:hypothetical protein
LVLIPTASDDEKEVYLIILIAAEVSGEAYIHA